MKLNLHAHRNLTAFQLFFLLSIVSLFAPAHLWCAADCDVATFSPPRVFSTGGSSYSVVVGDFNSDSKQDFVVDNASGVIVYLGDGLGGFLLPKTFFLGGFHESLTAGDFNGDGKPDLALLTILIRPFRFSLMTAVADLGPLRASERGTSHARSV